MNLRVLARPWLNRRSLDAWVDCDCEFITRRPFARDFLNSKIRQGTDTWKAKFSNFHLKNSQRWTLKAIAFDH